MGPRSSFSFFFRAIFLFCISLTLPILAHAGTYWVSPTGAAPWAACSGATPLNGTSACSLNTANSNLVAGDTVYLRGGTYDLKTLGVSYGISPNNNGTGVSNRITYAAYSGETPVIMSSDTSGADYEALYLPGSSYIRVTGITIHNVRFWARMYGGNSSGSNYNEIDHCTFYNDISYTPNTTTWGFLIGNPSTSPVYWSTNNWIHDNTMYQLHQDNNNNCTDDGSDIIRIGNAPTSNNFVTDNDNNNTIENNVLYYAGHALIDTYGMYGVIRNNVFHNEPWLGPCNMASSNPLSFTSYLSNYTGHRNFQVSDFYDRTGTFNLVEGNHSGYAGVNPDNDGADGLSLAAPQTIVRYNFFYATMNPGILLKYEWTGRSAAYPTDSGNGGSYGRIFNNTFYQNGYGYPAGRTCGASWCPFVQTAISLYDNASSATGNVLKNNLFYLSAGYSAGGYDVGNKGGPSSGWGGFPSGNAVNNWCSGTQSGGSNGGCSGSGNPQFNNPDISNPSSKTLPDLSLQSSSPAIDGGTYLTTATNSGSNSTTLTVADALYFQDGSLGSLLARASSGLGGTMEADWIAIGTVANTVQISSVSYGPYDNPAGTIKLTSPMTWSNGAAIWLYKKSDGTVVLNGSAPDYGASEYGGSSTNVAVLPPSGLQVVVR